MAIERTVSTAQSAPVRGVDTRSGQATWTDDAVISVRNVSKLYHLYNRPQDRLKHSLFSRFGRRYGREFWALRDVSCEVRPGEVLGIIGRNGSGKSTLLQILAGILEPTTGDVQVGGRVAALLELGSGFNPEYTGRENVFMNGAILGIPRKEMEQRFDEIQSFADIGEFIDQPVKLYSSGMFVRLAFAVTTGVDADVLLIDEALAVGDVFFRQKCYRRLETLRERGVSIVLVSHAMTEVEQFCQSALLLHHGEAIFQGSASEAVKRYYLLEQQDRVLGPTMQPRESPPSEVAVASDDRDHFWPSPEAFLDTSGVAQVSNGWARCTAVALCDSRGRPRHVFEQGETASFFYEVELLADIGVPTGGVEMANEKGTIVHGKTTLEYGSDVPREVGRGSRLRFRQDITLEIAIGEYTFNVGVGTLSPHDYDRRSLYAHAELDARLIRLCLLPAVGMFAVVFRVAGTPVQLLHHGVADLRGECRVSVVGAPAGGPSSVSAAGGSAG